VLGDTGGNGYVAGYTNGGLVGNTSAGGADMRTAVRGFVASSSAASGAV
jgi:hypothetical protein